jgi:hypothetical protein
MTALKSGEALWLLAEDRRRKQAIEGDRDTLAFDFEQVSNPGIYAEDPLWKQFWKTDGVRALNPDGSVITDQMERFRQPFELGYMACRKIEGARNDS